MDFKDYYKSLGLNKKASEKEVKDAFKKLAKKHHPDAEGGSEDKFKEINEAYEVLKDQEKRNRYDYLYYNLKDSNNKGFDSKAQTYKQQKMYSDIDNLKDYYEQRQKEFRENKNREKGQEQKKDENNFSDFFEMFFGKHKERAGMHNAQPKQEGQQNKAQAVRGQDYELDIELSLEEAYHGSTRKIEITSTPPNPPRRLEVSIPSGVRNGTKIKVSNEGKPGKDGGQAGDLYLKVKLKEHNIFWLDNDDVHSELKIEPHEAVLGANKRIQTIADLVELVIPPNTHSGRILRLRSKGLKNSKGEILGDHYIHIVIDIPEKLSHEEVMSYRYLKEQASKR